MRCHTCSEHYDDARQSVVCPHRLLDTPDAPSGGPRLQEDQRAGILDAYRMRDQMRLYRFMGHGNAAVRLYARQMSELIDNANAGI